MIYSKIEICASFMCDILLLLLIVQFIIHFHTSNIRNLYRKIYLTHCNNCLTLNELAVT